MKTVCITICFLLILPINSRAQFSYDPGLDWKTLTTTHFAIHYNQDQDSFAGVVAQKAEWYYTRLAEIFHYAPTRIEIVLDFSYDYLIDAATVFPNATIFLNPTPHAFMLGHYDDWLDLVLAHELTHVVDLDKLGGIAEVLRKLIGRFYFPGAYGPQWLTEGLATFLETELTGSGRCFDPYHDMLLRMAFLENRVTRPDQNCAFLARWPGGTSSYVYGMSFYRYIVDNYQRESIIKMRERYASNLIPFQVSNAITAATGYGLKQVYRDWKNELETHYHRQEQEIRKIGITSSTQLTHDGYENWSPVWSADGKQIYYVSSNADRHQEIRLVELTTGRQQTLKSVNIFETRMSHTASSQPGRLFFSQLEWKRSYAIQNDIWQLDLASNKCQNLKTRNRGRHPAVHPYGEKIAYVTSDAGQTDLWQYDIGSATNTLLLPGGPDRLFFNPSWAPDGRRLALSVWQKGGYQNIWIYDLDSNKLQPLLLDKAWDLSPCWSHDGRYIVFSSDRTGVYNLFSYDLETHQLRQITNVLGGAFDPALAPDDRQVAFVGYSSRGFDVHVMNWDKNESVRTFKVIMGVDIEKSPLFVYGYADSATPPPQDKTNAFDSDQIPKYRPFRTLMPRFYLPLPTIDESGQALSVFTYGQDVINKHAYLLGLQYGFQSHRFGYSLNYVNNSFYPLLNLNISDLTVSRNKDVLNEKGEQVLYWDHRKELALAVVIPFRKIDTVHQPGIGLRHQQYARAITLAAAGYNPYFEGTLRSLNLQYLFSNAHSFPRSISPIEGMIISVNFDWYLKRLDSDLVFYQFELGLDKFMRVPFTRRHVIQLGGLAGKNNLETTKNIENMSRAQIHGFPTFTWKSSLYKATLAYQFPLLEIERSTPLLPIFLQRFHASLFRDVARYQNLRHHTKILETLGLELRLDLVWGYLLEGRTRLGIALPLHSKESASVYLDFGLDF